MKRDIKLVTTGVVVGAMLVGGIATASSLITGEVYNNQFPILLNGKDYTTQMPILNYQERTYVPLRELAELTGSEVDFVDNEIIIRNNNSYIYTDIGLSKKDVEYIKELLMVHNFSLWEENEIFSNKSELSSDNCISTIGAILEDYNYGQKGEFDIYRNQRLEEDIPNHIGIYVYRVYNKSTIEKILKDIYGLENIDHNKLIENIKEEWIKESIYYENGKYYIRSSDTGGEGTMLDMDAIYLNENNQYEVRYSLLKTHLGGIYAADGPFETVLEKTENGFRILSNQVF